MNREILERYKRENFDSLDEDGIKSLIEDTILDLRNEFSLSELELSFLNEGFGYDPEKNILNVDFDAIKGDKNPNYVLFTGIIHEMRHKYQIQFWDKDFIVYPGGWTYHLDPREKDAHKYTSKELLSLSTFFNDNEFDKYVFELLDTDKTNLESTRRFLTLSGYTSKSADEYALAVAKSVKKVGIYIDDDNKNRHEITADGKFLLGYDDENGSMVATKMGKKSQIELGFQTQIDKDNNVYVRFLVNFDDMNSADIRDGLINHLEALRPYIPTQGKEYGKIIFIPVFSFIDGKEYEQLLKDLSYDENGIDFETFKNLKDISTQNLLHRNLHLSREENMQRLFGINYKDSYTPEQIVILNKVIDDRAFYGNYVQQYWYGLDEGDRQERLSEMKEELQEEDSTRIEMLEYMIEHKGVVLSSQFVPEYSAEKMRLIYAAQISGLNTILYTKLNEEQIEETMIAELEGMPREEIIKAIFSDTITIGERRLQFEKENNLRHKRLVIEDYKVELEDFKEQAKNQTRNQENRIPGED